MRTTTYDEQKSLLTLFLFKYAHDNYAASKYIVIEPLVYFSLYIFHCFLKKVNKSLSTFGNAITTDEVYIAIFVFTKHNEQRLL